MKPSPIEKVREMYDAMAESYANMMEKEIDLPIYKEVLGRLRTGIVNTRGTLVDTACGSGHMLSLYRERFEPLRSLIGVDLSPEMVAITRKRLGPGARVFAGDMRDLSEIDSCSAAAVLNFFSIHHLDTKDVQESMHEWSRILVSGGQLFVAAWEGTGLIDYGESANIIAFRYTASELSSMANDNGFTTLRCVVEPVEDFPMDAVYLECRKELSSH